MKVFFEKFERDTSFEEGLPDYDVSDFEIVDEFNESIYDLEETEIPELSEKKSFVFVDGVMRGEIRGGIELSGELFDFSVFLMCVGAGFENGEMVGVKKKKIFVLHSSASHHNSSADVSARTDNISDESENRRGFFRKLEELGYVVLHAPLESTDDTIMNVMREEEISVCLFVLEKFPDVFCVIDGNIPWRLALQLSGDFPPRVFSIVKNVMWVFERGLENLEYGRRSEVKLISHTRKKGIEKFSFFLRVKGKEGDMFRTTDFIRIEFPFFSVEERNWVSAFADFVARKVSGWMTNVGDRAPWNIAPMRILEKKLRAYLGDSRISERKIKREITEVASGF